MEEQLIELVRTYKILYEVTSKDYRNQKARGEAWEAIGREIGKTGTECKEIWTKLRNAYTNACKRRKTTSGQAAKKIAKWKFEEQMSFLEPTLAPRTTLGSMSCAVIEDEDKGCNYSETKDDDNFSQDVFVNEPDLSRDEEVGNSQITTNLESISHSPVHISTRSSPPPSTSSNSDNNPTQKDQQRNKKRSIDSSIQSMVKIMEDNIRLRKQYLSMPPASTQTVGQHYPQDETDMYFLSLATTVKQLSREEQARVKMDIGNVVFQAELRDIQLSKLRNCPQTHFSPTSAQSNSSDTMPLSEPEVVPQYLS